MKLFHTDSKELQDDLDLFEKWVTLNGMELAIKKCFHFRLSNVYTQLMLYGTPLKQVSVVRDLGIHIRSDLSFGQHFQIRLNKANSAFSMFRRSLPERVHWHAKLCLYKSAILPIITFGSVCFSISRCDMRIFEDFQERVTKWILNYKVPSYIHRMKILKVLPVSMILQFLDILHLAQICQNANNVDYSEFISINNNKNWVLLDFFDLPRVHLQRSRAGFFFRSQRLINNLPHYFNLKETNNLKRRLLEIMHTKFETNYDENNPCSWILSCDCSNRRDVRQLWLQEGEQSPTQSHNKNNNNNKYPKLVKH